MSQYTKEQRLQVQFDWHLRCMFADAVHELLKYVDATEGKPVLRYDGLTLTTNDEVCDSAVCERIFEPVREKHKVFLNDEAWRLYDDTMYAEDSPGDTAEAVFDDAREYVFTGV